MSLSSTPAPALNSAPAAGAAQALRLARREMRGAGGGGFHVFLGCLVLGVAAIAGIGSLAAAVDSGIRGDARSLLGGDVSAQFAYRTADAAEQEFLDDSGDVSRIATMRAMARSADGARNSLIELKAVDDPYPLVGAVELEPAQGLHDALAERAGDYGAVVDPAILARLGVAVGGQIKIGTALLQVRATLTREPDAVLAGLTLGPRVMVSRAALTVTGLIQPGALVSYDYRIRLPAGADAAAWIARARTAFPEAGWRLRSYADAAPAVRRFIDRIGLFLSLVGITTLLVGGVGVANAVAGYVAGKTTTIATLKCLGASNRLVFATYLAQILALAGLGIAAGVALGWLLPVIAAPALRSLLPVPLRFGFYPAPLALAALFGLLTTLAFSLWPLAATGRVPAAALFRDTVAPGRRRFPPIAATATALAVLALAGLTVATARDRNVALWYVAGAAASFAIFRGAGWLITAGARRLGRPHQPALRLALANLHRPGAPTARVVLSLGIGLTVLTAIALVQSNLSREIGSRMADGAPGYFFIDIQPDQLARFTALVEATPGARLDTVPMMRARITRLNGVPVAEAHVADDAQWALRRDMGLTYSATPPALSPLVAGSWWPADYHGPPLISFDAKLAQGMGLKIGDTLSVNLLGREITARIANLRTIDWGRLGINFAIVFAPGTLEAAPQTRLAAVYLPQAEEDALAQRIAEALPNVTAIRVRDALAAVDRIIATIGQAMRLTALATLGAGVLVLGGAVAAGHRRRVYDAVVLKVLGATRRTIAAAFVIEHGLLGLASAAIAGGIGTLAAYFLVTGPLRGEWTFLPLPLIEVLAGATGLTLVLGFAGTWRALGAPAAPLLRNE